jgi:Zn finger protein HypA/HybF involved in hydrogenase expression
MITKKQLIDFIKNSSDEAIVTIFGQGEIIYIIQDSNILLSSQKPIGYCNKCGEYVYEETTQGLEQYKGYCPNCNENLYKSEIILFKQKKNE